jgi:rubrerythrin
MAVTKKASIVAFSNYLAFTSSARQKEEITKTKYLKMIQMIEDEHYRDSLVINSKISNFLQD